MEIGGRAGAGPHVVAFDRVATAWAQMSHPAARAWILGAIMVAIVVRAPGLDREITHDEAYSWLKYASTHMRLC